MKIDLDDAVNELLKHAPAFEKIEIYPSMPKSNPHTVIADGKYIQGDPKRKDLEQAAMVIKKLRENQKQVDPDINKILNENFMDLF